MRFAIVSVFALAYLLCSAEYRPALARASANDDWVVSTGVSELLVLGPVTSGASTSWDVSARARLYRAVIWAAGARLSFAPLSPELFLRLGAEPRIGSWVPSLGVEVGVSGRVLGGNGNALLAELREQARSGVAPVYLATHAMPLRFVLWESLWLSVLDLQVGTYVAPFGRFVRLQLGFVAGGFAL